MRRFQNNKICRQRKKKLFTQLLKSNLIDSVIVYLKSFDNSDYQRNGDYFPTRLNVQKDGINLIGMTKIRSNPENNVGLLTYAK